jgi:hypothetical protein
VPSQNGFFVDAPQRQSTVLVCVGKTFPFVSRSSIEPLTMYGPFGLASIVTSAMNDLPAIFPKVKSLTRLPAGDGPGKRPRLIAIGDARQQSAQLNGGRQLAALITVPTVLATTARRRLPAVLGCGEGVRGDPGLYPASLGEQQGRALLPALWLPDRLFLPPPQRSAPLALQGVSERLLSD